MRFLLAAAFVLYSFPVHALFQTPLKAGNVLIQEDYVEQPYRRCQLVKIAPKYFLTAGHCGRLYLNYKGFVQLNTREKYIYTHFKIKKIHMNDKFKDLPAMTWEVTKMMDLAMIEFDEETPKIPQAAIIDSEISAENPVMVSQELTCPNIKSTDHFLESKITPFNELYFTLPGQACNGNSGGGVFAGERLAGIVSANGNIKGSKQRIILILRLDSPEAQSWIKSVLAR